MIVTKEIINRGKSRNGGWSNKQLILLGEPKGFSIKGWKRRIIGRNIPESNINEFLSLKDKHLTGEKKKSNRSAEYNLLRNKKKKKKKEEKRIKDLYARNGFVMPKEPICWAGQYRHPNWQRLRLKVMKRDGFKCRQCRNKEEILHVHHLSYEGSYIWEVNDKKLLTLCETCHNKEHSKIA